MKKEDRIINIIDAHIHNLANIGRPVNKRHLKEWFQQVTPDKLSPYLNHGNSLVREAANEVQKMKS